jgi:hypothetical protein
LHTRKQRMQQSKDHTRSKRDAHSCDHLADFCIGKQQCEIKSERSTSQHREWLIWGHAVYKHSHATN